MVQASSRPSWTDYFLGLAFMVSQRSADERTKHGCVLVDANNHIIATGYNSFPRGMDDAHLPQNRPDPSKPDELNKYDFVDSTHSERNALYNCMVSPWSLPGPVVAYVTGEPCNSCLAALWQSNVRTVYHAKRYGSALLNERTRKVKEIFLAQTGMELIEVEPNLDWLAAGLQVPGECGFIHSWSRPLQTHTHGKDCNVCNTTQSPA